MSANDRNGVPDEWDVFHRLADQIDDAATNLCDGWDSTSYSSLSHQVFLEYYQELPEISLRNLGDAEIQYEQDDVSISLIPFGDTPLGTAYVAQAPEQGTETSLFVLAGSLLTTGFADNLSSDQLLAMERWAKHSIPDDVIVVKHGQDKFDILTRGLCKEGYLVLLPAFTADEVAKSASKDTETSSYLPFGDYRHCSIRLEHGSRAVSLYVSLHPVITQQRVMIVQLVDRTAKGIKKYSL